MQYVLLIFFIINDIRLMKILLPLILMYPEIYWIFIFKKGCEDKPYFVDNQLIDQYHFIEVDGFADISDALNAKLKAYLHGFRTYFDPSSIRNYFREQFLALDSEGKGHSANGEIQSFANYLINGLEI